ncbi:prophage tail fiber N-terminal domain-containing protein [Escherichia coli]|nr:prophage tail fiber N-terminal domain-containing protein [Escherichia coli]
MAVQISGVLKDGAGKPVQNGIIQLKAARSSATVLAGTVASVNPDEAGRYSMDVEYGRYGVTLMVDGYPPSYIGDITVSEDSQPGALNDFLLEFTEQDARPEVMVHLGELVSRARENAEAAASCAEEVEKLAERVKQIFGSIRAMDATTTQKGLVQLCSATDCDSEEQAATPKAVKIVMDEMKTKAPLDSPAFTGTPTTPTPPPDASGNEIASVAFVRTLIARLSEGQDSKSLTVNRLQLQSGCKTGEPLPINCIQIQAGYEAKEPLAVNCAGLHFAVMPMPTGKPLVVNQMKLYAAHPAVEPLRLSRTQLNSGHTTTEPMAINHALVQSGYRTYTPALINRLQLQAASRTNAPLMINHPGLHFAVVTSDL